MRGFTLFETLVYIALFSFIMSGIILSAYQIFESSARVKTLADREVELNFVLRKLEWLLNSVTNVSVLDDGGTLQVLHNNGEIFSFTTAENVVTLKKDGKTYNLSGPRLNVSNLNFDFSTTTYPNILQITMMADGKVIGQFTKFIR